MNKLIEAGEQSESIAALLDALATAHAKIDNVSQDREVEVPIKDKANPGSYKGKYKFRYATLAGILTELRPALTENGIWYTQRIRGGEMITRLFHRSGEWMDSGHIPMPDIKGSPQDIGSVVSYFKRYSLSEALGIASEEDSDGGEAGDRDISFRARGAPANPSETFDTEEPPQGWGDWTRGLIRTIQGKDTSEDLDALRDANKRLLNVLKRADATMFEDIGKAFAARRGVVDKNAPI